MAEKTTVKVGPFKSAPPETAPAGQKVAPTDGAATPTTPVPGKQMAQPVKATVTTPKSVYFPNHEGKPAPTSHPAPPGSPAAALGSQQQQTQERE